LSKIADFQSTFPRSASAVKPSEKVQLALIGSPCALSNESKMIIVRCPYKPRKGGSKPQNCRFPSKIALRMKKVCYKVCENCQRQRFNAFIGLTIRTKWLVGGWPPLLEILGQTDRVGAKSPIFKNLLSVVATQPWHLSKKSN